MNFDKLYIGNSEGKVEGENLENEKESTFASMLKILWKS